MSTKQRNNQTETKTNPKRVTIIKHMVGSVRTQADPIPNITFGIPNKIDEEGAGDVIQSWAQSEEPMKFKKIMYRSFPDTNVKALQHGCLNSQTQRDFALKNPVMKSLYKQQFLQSQRANRNRKHNKLKQQKKEGQQRVFGIRSIANNVSIQELLKSVHGDFEESDYPDRSHRPKKGRLPPAKSTNASRLLEASISSSSIKNASNEEKVKEEKNCFKMKRFLNVDSTVKRMLQQ